MTDIPYRGYDFESGDVEISLDHDDTSRLVTTLERLARWATDTATAITSERYEPPVPACVEERIVIRGALDILAHYTEDGKLPRDQALARLHYHMR